MRQTRWRFVKAMVFLAWSLSGSMAMAYVVTIQPGVRALYLVVGLGSMAGGSFSSGGTPANNSSVNSVFATVPSASVGAGPVAMSTDSPVTNSYWDNFPFCSIPSEVYVGGFYRTPGNGSNAILTATVPTTLVAGANSLPFNTISWVSGGSGDSTPTIPSGAFVAGSTQTLLSVARNSWFESCLQFTYSNAIVAPAGSYKGRVTYTLMAP